MSISLLPDFGYSAYRFAPVVQHSEEEYAYKNSPDLYLEWGVKDLFGLEQLPENFWKREIRDEFRDFISYIESKGNYKPNPEFLKHVLRMIESREYPYTEWCWEQLQAIETTYFYKTGNSGCFANHIVSSTKKSLFMQKQGFKKGFQIEMQLEPQYLRQDQEQPSTLAEMSYRVMLKNGYPQAFVNTKR